MTLEREALITRTQAVAAKLGKQTVSRAELKREAGITQYLVHRHFDNHGALLAASGLEQHPSEPLSDDQLFSAARDLFLKEGGICRSPRFISRCAHAYPTYRNRWGNYQSVLAAFREWVAKADPSFPYLDDLPTAPAIGRPAPRRPASSRRWPEIEDGQRYGAFLQFRGIEHAPTIEAGVVFLFGMVAQDLGFVVESFSKGFPDCEAKRRVQTPVESWQRVRIEFEYQSRKFRDHGHDPAECDIIVCWEHNWPGCPLEVIALEDEIGRLRAVGERAPSADTEAPRAPASSSPLADEVHVPTDDLRSDGQRECAPKGAARKRSAARRKGKQGGG